MPNVLLVVSFVGWPSFVVSDKRYSLLFVVFRVVSPQAEGGTEAKRFESIHGRDGTVEFFVKSAIVVCGHCHLFRPKESRQPTGQGIANFR